MNSSTTIILGSSASKGNTYTACQEINNKTGADIIDLNNYSISAFDYNHENREDDFIPLMRSLVDNYETLIFATPVYWYNMSGTMKIFFDRISDLLKIEKDLGRKLRGKSMAAISCSGDDDQGEYFWQPFIKSADYLGMEYKGHVHLVINYKVMNQQSKLKLDKFIDQLKT